MTDPTASFRLVSDRLANGNAYWRAYFNDPLTGNRRKLSTGVFDDGTKAAKQAAQSVGLEMLATMMRQPEVTKGRTLFRDFVADFWDWDKSIYIKALLARDPKAIAKEWTTNCAGMMANYAVPMLGHLALEDITPDVLDTLVTDLLLGWNGRKPLASGTVKHVVHALSPVFQQAVRRELITYNPVPSMLPFVARRQTRDAFTVTETAAMLSVRTVATVWAAVEGKSRTGNPGKQFKPDMNPWAGLGIATLVACTGARVSMVLALTREDLVLRLGLLDGVVTRYYEVNLDKKLQWATGVSPGSKTGDGTLVPVAAELLDEILLHLPAKGVLFAGRGRHGIMTLHTASRRLGAAMRRCGITAEEQARRLLGFHAFRHTFETEARAAGLSAAIRSGFTEHKDERTSGGYAHLRGEHLLPGLHVQRRVVG